MVVALDDLEKESRSILHWLGKYLQQVAVIVIVHQDAILLQLFCVCVLMLMIASNNNEQNRNAFAYNVQIFDYFHFGFLQLLFQIRVVGRRRLQELHASRSQVLNLYTIFTKKTHNSIDENKHSCIYLFEYNLLLFV